MSAPTPERREAPVQFRVDKWSTHIRQMKKPAKEMWPDAYHWFATRADAISFIETRHAYEVLELEKKLKRARVKIAAFKRKEALRLMEKPEQISQK